MTTIRDEGARGVAVANDAWELLNIRHASNLFVLRIE